MRFFYHTFVFFMVILPVLWFNILLSSLFNAGLFLYSTVVILSVCMLRKSEAIFCTICLGLLIDAVNLETKLWGISALLLSAPVILFQDNTWRNVFKFRTFFWGIFLNIVLHLIFVSLQFLLNDIPFRCLNGYFLSIILSGIMAALLLKLLLKIQYKYLL